MQFTEMDLRGMPIGPASTKGQALVEAMCKSRNVDSNHVDALEEKLKKEGFVDVRITTKEISLGKWAGPEGALARELVVGAEKSMRAPALKAGGLGMVSSAEEFDRIIDDSADEWDRIPGAVWKTWVVCAQKPE